MKQVKTMRGKIINVDEITQSNEKTIAVTGGGPAMNARGDILGKGGKIVKRIEQRQKDYVTQTGPQQTQKVSLAELDKYKGMINKPSKDNNKSKLQKKQEQDKKAAVKRSKEIMLNTEAMIHKDGIVTDHSAVEAEDDTSKVEEKKTKKSRKIVDSEE